MPPVIGSALANGPVTRWRSQSKSTRRGPGAHTREDIYKSGCADVDAVAATLGDRPFLLGDTPSSYDAILYGFACANTIAFPAGVSLSRLRAKAHETSSRS